MMNSSRLRLCVCIVLLLLSLSGCGREFDPVWRVVDFRVMSIKSDPITVKTGESATLSALVNTVPGEQVTYAWSWCPIRTTAQDSYVCPLKAEDLAGLFGDQLPSGIDPAFFDFDLGTEPTAELVNILPAPMLLDFCRKLQRQLTEAVDPDLAKLLPGFDCRRGYEVSVRLVATSGDKEIVTAKRLTLWTGSEQINENPRYERFEIRPENASDARNASTKLNWVRADLPHDEQWVEVPEDAPLEILAGVAFEVRALLEPDSVQVWEPPAPEGSDREWLDPERETIGYSWFTTLGELSDFQKVFLEGENTLEKAGSTNLKISRDDLKDCVLTDGVCEVKLWSVARDSRLGVDWIGRTLVVVE